MAALDDLMAAYKMYKGGDPGNEDPVKPKNLKAYSGGSEKTPTGMSNEFNYSGGLKSYLDEAVKRGLNIEGINSNEDFQGRIYDKLMGSPDGRIVLRNMWKNYGDTKAGTGGLVEGDIDDERLGQMRNSFVDGKLGVRTQQLLPLIPNVPNQSLIPPPEQKLRDYNSIEGQPISYPGELYGDHFIKHPAGAFTGIRKKDGSVEWVEPEDYKRMGVPEAAQLWIESQREKDGWVNPNPNRNKKIHTLDYTPDEYQQKMSDAWEAETRTKFSGFGDKTLERELLRNPYKKGVDYR